MDQENKINPIAQSYIDNIGEACKKIHPKVVIRCITYNHGKYLRDCLDGFVMQKTDFPFIAVVHEDASTDNTAEILKEYAEKFPDIIFPIFEKENQYSKRNGSIAKIMTEAIKVSEAKYVAICEGDDYWTDSNKLQKQIDFLDNHQEYSMCFHSVKLLFDGFYNKKDNLEKITTKDYTAAEILTSWTVPTCSTVMRTSVYNKVPVHKDFIVGDNVWWATCLSYGKVRGFSDHMGIYRRNAGGWSAKHFERNIRHTTMFKWLKHYKAMKECFTDINTAIFDNLILSTAGELTIICLFEDKLKAKFLLMNYYRYYRMKYIKSIIIKGCEIFIKQLKKLVLK